MKPKEARQMIDDAIDSILPANVEGCINWGDLGCVDVVVGENLEGPVIVAYIEELHPVNPHFEEVLRKRLKGKLDDWDVQFVFEW